jgi:hypothetical protein
MENARVVSNADNTLSVMLRGYCIPIAGQWEFISVEVLAEILAQQGKRLLDSGEIISLH